jgi:hypothetical protein
MRLSTFCGLHRDTEQRRPDWHEASPGLLAAKCSRWRSPAGSGPANMVANPPRSRIPLCFLPRTPGQPGGMGLCQILLEDVVAIWIHLLDPEDYILPEKVHINVRANLFADANEQSDISGCCCPLCAAPYAPDKPWGRKDTDGWVHVGNREVYQVTAFVVIDGHGPF